MLAVPSLICVDGSLDEQEKCHKIVKISNQSSLKILQTLQTSINLRMADYVTSFLLSLSLGLMTATLRNPNIVNFMQRRFVWAGFKPTPDWLWLVSNQSTVCIADADSRLRPGMREKQMEQPACRKSEDTPPKFWVCLFEKCASKFVNISVTPT